MIVDLTANTDRKVILCGDFVIEESVGGWEWTHKDYPRNPATGFVDTVFDAIEAAKEWHEENYK